MDAFVRLQSIPWRRKMSMRVVCQVCANEKTDIVGSLREIADAIESGMIAGAGGGSHVSTEWKLEKKRP